MRRVFICVERNFPAGDAGANRVLHMAMALQYENWKVIVMSMGHYQQQDYNAQESKYYHKGIEYYCIPETSDNLCGRIKRRAFNGHQTAKLLAKQNLRQGDTVIIYSTAHQYIYPILHAIKGLGCQLVFDVVEWHQKFQFKNRILYLLYKRCFNKIYPKADKIIAISKNLKHHFEEVGCPAIVYPVCIDSQSRGDISFCDNSEIHMIYPGNPFRKDSLPVMLQALDMLTDEEKKRIRFHLTGVKREHLYKCVPNEEQLFANLCKEGVVAVHGWMKYDELLELYQKVQFTLIARPDNQVTQSNFPSKVPELMNMGIVPIVNRVGDLVNYLQDGINAVLYTDCSAASCCAAIRKCISLDPDGVDLLRKNAKACAEDQFDYKKMAHALSEFLME